MIRIHILSLCLTLVLIHPLKASNEEEVLKIDDTIKELRQNNRAKIEMISDALAEHKLKAKKECEDIRTSTETQISYLGAKKKILLTQQEQAQFKLGYYYSKLSTLPPMIHQLAWITSMQVTHTEITDIPVEISGCVHLETLNLSHNRISRFPMAIILLKKLKVLNLRMNLNPNAKGPMSLPGKISELASLKGLFLGGIIMNELPPQLWDLTTLQRLELPYLKATPFPNELEKLVNLKQLQSYPMAMGSELTLFIPEKPGARINVLGVSEDMAPVDLVLPELAPFLEKRKKIFRWNYVRGLGALTQFDYIRQLKLNKVGLRSLPDDIYRLRLLENLDVRQNQLTELPEGLTRLAFLRVLKVGKNKIQQIPRNLSQLKKLTTFMAENNLIETIPSDLVLMAHLQTLVLSHNNIEQVPYGLATMTSLVNLNLRYNLINYLPSDFYPHAKYDDFDGMEFQGYPIRSAFIDWLLYLTLKG